MAEPESSSSVEIPHCNHFVIRKKRLCRMSVKSGQKYCGEHQLPLKDEDESVDTGALRVVCPLDRKHTCYAHKLQKHLKICNARPVPDLPYIKRGINAGDVSNSEVEGGRLLAEFSSEDIIATISKVNKITDELSLCDKVSKRILTHKLLEEEMEKPEYGDKTKKHLKQASAILRLLEVYGFVIPNTCFVEFGAGRGQLSYWIAKTMLEQNIPASFLLVERSSPKHKRDNKLDKSDDKVQRIRADIADLVLDRLESIKKSASIVGITKHLCGDATDLAIRCLVNVDNKESVGGCIMTFCCHHRCRWGSFAGKSFFENVGLGKNEFDIMSCMSSWATCGSGYSRERRSEAKDDCTKINNDRDKEIGLNREQKEEVGKKCKSLINWGRLKFLQDLGFECHLHYYVEPEVSLENVCIIAINRVNAKETLSS